MMLNIWRCSSAATRAHVALAFDSRKQYYEAYSHYRVKLMKQYTIGELSKRTDTKVVTIRYYEGLGILPIAPRSKSNYRVYGQDQLERLLFVRRARALGFTLQQVRDLLTMTEQKGRDCCAVDEIARSHLADVERKVADLSRLANELKRVLRQCRGGTIKDCRIVEALSGGSA